MGQAFLGHSKLAYFMKYYADQHIGKSAHSGPYFSWNSQKINNTAHSESCNISNNYFKHLSSTMGRNRVGSRRVKCAPKHRPNAIGKGAKKEMNAVKFQLEPALGNVKCPENTLKNMTIYGPISLSNRLGFFENTIKRGYSGQISKEEKRKVRNNLNFFFIY